MGSVFAVRRLLIPLLILTIPTTSCRKKKSGGDEASDLIGEGTPVIVSGSQPANGTTVVISNGQVTVVAVDNTGQILAEPPRGFTIKGPEVTSTPSPNIVWTSSEKATSYDIKISTTNDCKSVVASATGVVATEWIVAAALSQGNYFICVTAKNKYGQKAASNNAYQMAVDLTEPPLTLNDPGEFINSFTQASFNVSGSCSTGTVTVKAEDWLTSVSTDVSCLNLQYSADLNVSTLMDVTITLSVTNGAMSANDLLKKDTVPATITGLANDAVVTNQKTWTWGCSETNCSFRHLVDTVASSDPSGAFSSAISISHSSGNGTVYLHIQSKDEAGNISSTAHISAVMDTTVPVVSITNAPDVNAAGRSTYGFSGSCSEALGNVAWTIDDTGNGSSAPLTGSANCDGSSWSVSTLDLSGFSDGTLTITADLTDSVGNHAVTATENSHLDATIPEISITYLPTITLTYNTNYPFSGTCSESGALVYWSIDDDANGATASITGTASCNGTTWEKTGVDVSSLDQGPVHMTADLTDATGNPATQATKSATKDTVAPAINLNALSYVNIANQSTYAISGICDENGLTVAWSFDDQGNGATTPVSGNSLCSSNEWSASGIDLSSLSDGTLNVSASMDDNIGPEFRGTGNDSATVTKDVVVPSLSVNSPPYVNAANRTSYSFSGNCDVSLGTVTYSVDDAGNGATAPVTGTANCNGTTWTATNVNLTGLDDGTLTITVNLSDAVGNDALPGGDSTTKDTVIPTVTISAVGIVTGTNETSFALSGTCSEDTRNVNISVDDQANGATVPVTETVACAAPNWNVNINLSSLDDGILDITVSHTDVAGNPANPATTTATHDSMPPTVPNTFILNSPASNLSNNPNPQLRFTGLAGNELVRIFSDNSCTSQVATGTASSSNLNITVPLTVDGPYTFYATAEDTNGNRSDCSTTSLTYTLDRVINAITAIDLFEPSTSPSNDLTPTVTVSGVSSGDTVKLYTSGNCFVAEQIGFAVSGGVSVNVNVDAGKFTADATYQIFARSSDAAGNSSDCTVFSRSYQLDTSPPSPPTGVVRATPVSSPGTDTTPTFTVSGVTNGYSVAIYSNSSCSNQLNSGTTAGTSITLATGTLSVDGTYTIYATQTDLAGNKSNCSTANGTYTLDILPPSLSNVHIESGGGKAVAGQNGYAIITFDASEPLQTTSVVILGRAATVINPSSLSYRATLQLLGSDPSGQVTFTIDYSDILANSGPQITATNDASILTYDNTNFAPVPTIANQSGAEASLLSFDINDGGDDLDGNSQAITYSNCYYDTTANGVVASTQSCTSLAGLTLNGSTGVIDWTPGYAHAGLYEFKVVATDGTVDGEAVFTVTIANTNRNPVLATVPDQNLVLSSIFNFDMDDTNSSSDQDIDGEQVSYSCIFDTTIDGSVSSSNNCSELDGVNFNGAVGYFTWTVQPTTPGDFEFKITGNDPLGGSGTSIFNVRVSIDISRIPQLCMVGNNVTSYFSSLSSNNEVSIEDAGGSEVFAAIKNVGDVFTFNTSAGYKLKCSGGCFAITPTQGTAAWSTQSYSGTLLSTYWGRHTNARIVIAGFDQAANFSINASWGQLATGSVNQESITVVDLLNSPFTQTALWIQSNAPISAYISTSNGTAYDQDGRVITAAAKESLGFVSGGGGTPSAVTTTQDNTYVAVYQNGKTTPTIDTDLDISELLVITDTVAKQNPASTAVAIYADKPVVSTQHADGDGTNATPSLPKSMLSTHFVTPMNGDYVSFAAYESGEVIIIDDQGTVISRNPLVAPQQANAPYAFSFPTTQTVNNSAITIPIGRRFVCSVPCMGIFEPQTNHDETLMTGTKMDPMGLTSTSFTDGGTIPADYIGNRPSECSGENDFPHLTWSNLPWGTKYLAIVIQDETAGNHVHLNLTDIDPSPGSIEKIEGASAPLTIPDGTNGDNGYATFGWSGPCDSGSAHTYRFKVYALSATVGQIDNMNMATFEATHAVKILDSASITGTYGP